MRNLVTLLIALSALPNMAAAQRNVRAVFVQPGQDQLLDKHMQWGRDCTATGLPNVRVTVQPKNGKLQVKIGPTGPSVAKDIFGDFVFLTDTAKLCLAQSSLDEKQLRLIERMLRRNGAKEIGVIQESCDLNSAATTIDIAAFHR